MSALVVFAIVVIIVSYVTIEIFPGDTKMSNQMFSVKGVYYSTRKKAQKAAETKKSFVKIERRYQYGIGGPIEWHLNAIDYAGDTVRLAPPIDTETLK